MAPAGKTSRRRKPGSGCVGPERGKGNSRRGWSDCPRMIAGDRITSEGASRRGKLLPYMGKSRREFIAVTSLGVMGAAGVLRGQNSAPQSPADVPPGAPPAFGAGPEFGPEVSSTTFAEAEKLVQFEMTPAERAVAAGSWR